MRLPRTALVATLASLLLAAPTLSGCDAVITPASERSATPTPGTRADATPPAPVPVPDTPAAPDQPAPPVVPPIPPTPPRPKPTWPALVEGSDISWPQCPKGMGIPQKRTLGIPMPLPTARFVVIGLTNGPAFYPNPCLGDQLGWAKDRHLLTSAYSVHSWPDSATLSKAGRQGPYDAKDRLGALSNVGYQQARFNIDSMKRVDFRTPMVWLDVEPVPVFEWSDDVVANAAVIRGAARGYTDAGYRIGVYSTPALYRGVVGDLDLGGIPEWRAAGQTSQAEALRRCAADWSIQGGKGILGQWVEDNRDRNVTCPGASKQMLRWFQQY